MAVHRFGVFIDCVQAFSLAAMKPAHMRQIPLHTPALGYQFSRDGHCNLFPRDRPDIQADGSLHTLEQQMASHSRRRSRAGFRPRIPELE